MTAFDNLFDKALDFVEKIADDIMDWSEEIVRKAKESTTTPSAKSRMFIASVKSGNNDWDTLYREYASDLYLLDLDGNAKSWTKTELSYEDMIEKLLSYGDVEIEEI